MKHESVVKARSALAAVVCLLVSLLCGSGARAEAQLPAGYVPLAYIQSTGTRAFDYEIRAVTETGKLHAVKRFLSPAFCRPARYEPCRQVFRFDGMDVPETGTYHFEVSPRNSFGRPGRPLLSPLLRSVPGKDISRGMNWRQV